MRSYTKGVLEGEQIFVGVDQDSKYWQVVIRTIDRILYNANIEAGWSCLKNLLMPYQGNPIVIAYEAGYQGKSI
jgi:hypothetical protein